MMLTSRNYGPQQEVRRCKNQNPPIATNESQPKRKGSQMNKLRQWWLAGAAVTALVTTIGVGAVMAQTPTSTSSASPTVAAGSATSPTVAPGTTTSPATSNEDATHEARETAAQEAAEDSGQRMGGGAFKPNEDPAHEASESADREAAEDAGQVPGGAPTTPGATQSPTAN
jgi:cytoskeletal protein RodZ